MLILKFKQSIIQSIQLRLQPRETWTIARFPNPVVRIAIPLLLSHRCAQSSWLEWAVGLANVRHKRLLRFWAHPMRAS